MPAESYMKDDRFQPFSNGTEHMMWEGGNCQRGEKGCRKYRPTATTSRDGCPIEVAISLAACTDGTIPARIALRADLLQPGNDGKLHPHPKRPCVECPEFKGYDEPDDRPRRGPRPPKEQLDIFDPRNVPDREPSVLA